MGTGALEPLTFVVVCVFWVFFFFRQALAIKPGDRMTTFNLFKVRRQMCSWDGWMLLHVPEMMHTTIEDFKGEF
jgi:hypothetical protein